MLTKYLFGGMALGFVSVLLVSLTAVLPAHAQREGCAAPKYRGISSCPEDGGNTQVLLVDLTNPDIRFETVLAAYREPSSGRWIECADVNIPAYALPGHGCAVPGTGRFPGERVEDMVARYPGAAAAINADYFDNPGYSHGPEGLTIKRGLRFDGWRNGDCDSGIAENGKPFDFKNPTPCRSNDVKRSSLAISRSNHVEIGPKRWEDVENASLYANRFFNVVGGGPLIAKDGQAQPNQACQTEPLKGLGPCTALGQSAVGLTDDGRTLVLVTSKQRDAYSMAQLLTGRYKVQTAMKFDGGGSAQMWYDGQPFYATGEKRAVVDALLIFAPALLNYDAQMVSQPDMAVLVAGQTATLQVVMTNVGRETWRKGQVSLTNINGQPLGLGKQVALSQDVPPGKNGAWTLHITAPKTEGIYFSDWQLAEGGTVFGAKASLRVTVLPGAVGDWREQFERWVSERTGDVQRWFQDRQDDLARWVEAQRRDMERRLAEQLEQQLRQLCGGQVLVLVGMGWILARRRQR